MRSNRFDNWKVWAVSLLVLGMSALARAQDLTVENVSARMTPGINLGNTLEAIPTETSWGNPKPSAAYFQGIRRAGFRSVRIPVAWTQYSNEKNTIRREWMDHVADVVKLALDADLIVMINVHWDGGWLQPTPEKKQSAGAKLARFWTQISSKFRDFDDRLLFAGTNETMVEGQYGMPSPIHAQIQNGFNQTFLDAVRKSGGRNANRLLVVQGYNTDIDAALKFNTKMPRDTVRSRLLMELHYYSPYNFVLNDKSDLWQWGKEAEDPTKADTWGNEDFVDKQFLRTRRAFIEKGVPVILGEYSCMMKARFPGMNAYRLKWDEYVTGSAVRHGLIPMYWDTGDAIHRETGEVKDQELIDRIMKATKG